MSSIKKSAKTITQKSGRYNIGKSYSEFDNLNNIKDESNTYAISNITNNAGIKNRPSTLILSDFDFSIHDSATIEKIRIHYCMSKSNQNEGKNMELAPVTFRVKGAGAEFEFKGKSPTNQASTFISEYDTTQILGVSTSNVNSSFQLEMDFPANSGEAGSILLYSVFVEIIYTEGVYVLSSKVSQKQIIERDIFEVTLSLTNINQQNRYYGPTTVITLPEGVTYLGSDSDSFVRKSGNTIEWYSLFFDSWVDTVTLKLQATSTGDKTFKMKEKYYSLYSYQVTVGVFPKQTSLEFELPDYAIEDQSFEFTATSTDWSMQGGSSKLAARTIVIELPTEFNIAIAGPQERVEVDTSSDEKTVITWNILENTDSEMLIATLTPLKTGVFTIKGFDSDNLLIASNNIKITPKSYNTPFFAKYKLPEKVTEKMESGRVYSIVTYMRINLDDENIDQFEQYAWNYRFSIFHDTGTPEEYADDKYLLNTLGLEKSITKPNEWIKFELSFYYDDKYPIWLFWTGEYMERTPTLFRVEFTNPILEETSYYFEKGIEPYGTYFNPLKNVISPSRYGICNVPSINKSNPFRVSGFKLGGIENIENLVMQGVIINFDAVASSDCSIVARLRAGNKIGERSIVISEGSKSCTIGGAFDLFGIKYSEFINPQDLEVEFEVINKYNHDVKIEISNIHFTIRYSILGNKDWIKFWIDGESSEYYNIFLKSLTIDGGTETSVTYFNAEGCDTTIASRQNINPKTLELEVLVGECTLEEATLLFRRAAKWFTNDRDKYNKPILKNIEFEHIPGQIYSYILEDPLDGKLKYNEYDSKIKLKVPDGVSYTKESTVTAEVGVVSGIARVRPIICVMALSDEITILEKYSGQSWSIYSDHLDIGDTLTIDCDKRTVILDKSTTTGELNRDITSDVDFDCDWFNIKGEFLFQSNSCSIQSVEYKEREL